MTYDDPSSENVEPLRAEREEALRELDEAVAAIGFDRLREWAAANRPPQSWFDEPDDLLGDGESPCTGPTSGSPSPSSAASSPADV